MEARVSETASNRSSGFQSDSFLETEGASTPPGSLTTPSSGSPATTNEPLSTEAADFLSNLDNYLALGCFSFECSTAEGVLADFDGWEHVGNVANLIANSNVLSTNLQKLAAAGWIRMTAKRDPFIPRLIIIRLYILPTDVGHRFVDRQSKRLYAALESIIPEIDVSEESWKGALAPDKKRSFDPYAVQDEGSLFWMFNNLPSPSPSPSKVDEKYAREALEDLLDPDSVLAGLKTQMYPYQRRSAGLMLERESTSALQLDPRLEERTTPDGNVYYFGPRDLLFLRQPRYYENCKGGILAETMGLGKTVICLATILATKDHPPLVPAIYSLPPVRPSVASLSEMALSAINRKSVPWAVELDRVKHATGNMMENCRLKLQANPAHYEIPVQPVRWNRNTIVPPPKKMILASTTLIVVPRNLCKQWQAEIKKHIDQETLRVLVMDDSKFPLPPPDQLRTYDIVLFTRGRFESEIKDGSDTQGRRIGATQLLCRCPYIGATRIRDCHCLSITDLYDSPLKHLHFKRLIIDEGHFFSNPSGTAVAVANKLITADHRWVVSGTPAKDLLGVEVDMSAAENLWHTPNTKQSRDAVLDQRRNFSGEDAATGAIKSIGALASNFLRIKPWYSTDNADRKVDWDEYIYRHEDLRKRTFSGFSKCLRRTLRAMVVKTQPEDVERDINLPPLSHKVVRLEPSFYDKLTANLFTLVLTANAITSERTDVDYLFHKNSQKSRSQLIQNLRQSAFFWTGFSEADVEASLKSSNGYLDKEGTACTSEDRKLLTQTLGCAKVILQSKGWKALSRSHEIGLFVQDWPGSSGDHWAFDKSRSPLLTGLSQLIEAQRHVNVQSGDEDPESGLAGVGVRSTIPARRVAVKAEVDDGQKTEKPILTKGIPTSSLDGEPILRRRSSGKSEKGSPKKSSPISNAVKAGQERKRKTSEGDVKTGVDYRSAGSAYSIDADQSVPVEPALPPDSPFLQSRIVGTTSAKLSYLISRILKYYEEEKILIFYDGENVAYYIAQMLELLHIKHDIYAKSLPAHLKSEYVVRFDQDQQYRVLLMDVRNAAFGLNLPSASRIFFVNPVCRPNVEAQAIKRAHRIGQTRKVFVETLVLNGTIEEKMLERSKRMTRSEHQVAKVLEDDGGIRQIIQSARVLPVHKQETRGAGQMAPLEVPQQLWGRPGWRQFTDVKGRAAGGNKNAKRQEPDAQDKLASGAVPLKEKPVKRTLKFVDCTNPTDQFNEADDVDDQPLAKRQRRKVAFSTPPPASTPSPTMSKSTFAEPLVDGVVLPSPTFESVMDSDDTQAQYNRHSISQLMDVESVSPSPHGPGLVRSVLQRL